MQSTVIKYYIIDSQKNLLIQFQYQINKRKFSEIFQHFQVYGFFLTKYMNNRLFFPIRQEEHLLSMSFAVEINRSTMETRFFSHSSKSFHFHLDLHPKIIFSCNLQRCNHEKYHQNFTDCTLKNNASNIWYGSKIGVNFLDSSIISINYHKLGGLKSHKKRN